VSLRGSRSKLAAAGVAGACVIAAATVAVVELTGSSPARAASNVNADLCPFPLAVTVHAKGKTTSVRGLAFVGSGTTVTLRNTKTGRTATVRSTGSYAVNAKTGNVTWRGQRLWLLASGQRVPFMSSTGPGSLVRTPPTDDYVLHDAGMTEQVVDPCALVAPSAPSTRPLTTKAPWGLAPYALSQIEYAGVVPVLAALVRHDHVHLDVVVDGRPVTVPAGVGMAQPVDNGPCPAIGRGLGDCAAGHFYTFGVAVAPIHTHSTSGLIHIESDRPAAFTLGEFFDVWGVRLSKTCVGGYCTGGGGALGVYVNGRRVKGDPRNVVLTNRQEIAVAYGTPAQLRAAPSRYTKGWPGAGCGGAGERSCL
jgi:hypothetical protein